MRIYFILKTNENIFKIIKTHGNQKPDRKHLKASLCAKIKWSNVWIMTNYMDQIDSHLSGLLCPILNSQKSNTKRVLNKYLNKSNIGSSI